MRRLVIFLMACVLALTTASSVVAQDEEETIEIGAIEGTRAEVTFEGGSIIGMIEFEAAATEVDGSVDDPASVTTDFLMAECSTLQEASPPDIGDESVLLVGSGASEDLDFEIVFLVIQRESTFIIYYGVGLALVLDGFLEVVNNVADRDPSTPEEWMPTLNEMPTGFTVSDDEATPEADDDGNLREACDAAAGQE